MGQQQLLLVILVTIIVGIATVVAINTFSSAAESANVDAVRQDVAQIASSAQGYYMKPSALGGGGQDFTNLTMEDISFASDSASGSVAFNQNGTYEIASTSGSSFDIDAYPASCMSNAPSLSTTNCDEGTKLNATISESDITWTTN